MGGYGRQLDRGEDALFRRESSLRLMLCDGTGDLRLRPGEEDPVHPEEIDPLLPEEKDLLLQPDE